MNTIDTRLIRLLNSESFIEGLCDKYIFKSSTYWEHFEEDTHNRAYLNDFEDEILEHINYYDAQLRDDEGDSLCNGALFNLLRYLLGDELRDDYLGDPLRFYDECIKAYQENNWRYLTEMYIKFRTIELVNRFEYEIHITIYNYAEEYKEKQEHDRLLEELNKKLALRRIERNPIYQLGLGDKLRRKEHEKMFA